jgi:hypothetical protein
VTSLTGSGQSADDDKRSPFPSPPSPQHFRPESVVIVLGVMYPSVLPQLVEANTHLDLVPQPPGLVAGRQSEDVVFYHPLSSSRNGYEIPHTARNRRNSEGEGRIHRAEARKAVARDLALLQLGKRR